MHTDFRDENNFKKPGVRRPGLTTVLLKGNVALARNFLSSGRNHSIEQRVERVASQVNTRLDTLELASFNSARCEDSKELDTPHC